MKTRNQNKRQKVVKQERKIPQLTEDVMGIILKHVIQKHQIQAVETVEVIVEHFQRFMSQYGQCHCNFGFEQRNEYLHKYNFEWPKSLKTNSQRLVHHAELKMLPNMGIVLHFPLESYISSNRELDLIWEAIKHFDQVRTRNCISIIRGKMKPAEFIQKLRDHLRKNISLTEKLEAILT